jgi:putative DNA methylase
VERALLDIGQLHDELLAEEGVDFDAQTGWAVRWFEQAGFEEGRFGDADTLAKAKNIVLDALVESGWLAAKSGRVRLLEPKKLTNANRPPQAMCTWEVAHTLIKHLEDRGELAAAGFMRVAPRTHDARSLAYLLFKISARAGKSEIAFSYNALVQSWRELERLSREVSGSVAEQGRLSGMEDASDGQ